ISKLSIKDLCNESLELLPIFVDKWGKSFNNFMCRTITVRMHESTFIRITCDIIETE
ncbi:hypothetical protein BYT27DRAFT_7310059, partial [Phlegmacium glaucopus]